MQWPILCQLHNTTHLHIKTITHENKEGMVLTTMQVRMPNLEPIDVFPNAEMVYEVTQWTDTAEQGNEQCAALAVQRYDDIVTIVKSPTMASLIAFARANDLKLQIIVEGGRSITHTISIVVNAENTYTSSHQQLDACFEAVVMMVKEREKRGWGWLW